jgi:hypothetical protein
MAGFKSRSRRLRYERTLRSRNRELDAKISSVFYDDGAPRVRITKRDRIMAAKLNLKVSEAFGITNEDGTTVGHYSDVSPYDVKQAERKKRKSRKLIVKNGRTSRSAKYNPNTPKPKLKYVPDYGLPKPAFKKPTRYQYTLELGDELLTEAQYYELLKVGKVRAGSYKLTTKGYRPILGKKRIPHFN